IPTTALEGDNLQWLKDFFTRHHINVTDKGMHVDKNRKSFRKLWTTCPFIHASGVNNENDSYVLVYPDSYGFHCCHSSCNHRGWKEYREHYDGPAVWNSESPEKILGDPVSPAPRPDDGLMVVNWNDVTENIEWLVTDKIPLGAITLLAGEGGLGKSTAALDIGASVTTGRAFFNGQVAPLGDVVLFTAEDPDKVVKKRLRQQNANLDRFHKVDGKRLNGEKKYFDISDMQTLETAIQYWPETKLIIIDPVASYVSGIDTHKNADVRKVLTPLTDFAER